MKVRIITSTLASNQAVQIKAGLEDDEGNALVDETFTFEYSTDPVAAMAEMQGKLWNKLDRTARQKALKDAFPQDAVTAMPTREDSAAFLGIPLDNPA